jgi:hypothetical protein
MTVLNVKSLFILFMMFDISSATACSCRHTSTETVAYSSNHSLTKLDILRPSIFERILKFEIFSDDIKRIKVKVLEDIKGKYEQNFIDVHTKTNIGECGIKLDHGQHVYVINFKNDNGDWSNSINVCNIVNKNFAEAVKAQISRK